MSSLTMLASACGRCVPRVQVCPLPTSYTAATSVPLREATYEAAAPSGSVIRGDGGTVARGFPAANGVLWPGVARGSGCAEERTDAGLLWPVPRGAETGESQPRTAASSMAASAP